VWKNKYALRIKPMPNTRHHRHIVLVVLAWVAFSLAACGLNGEQTPPAIQLPDVEAGTCLVAPDISLGTINPFVYGVNHGPWAVITDKTLPYAQDAGVTMIRFPGGNWGDENDLQPYHIDQFVQLAEQMGSEVSLTVRLFGGSPEKAAALVQYANIDHDYGIRYWAIGNEPTLYATARGAPDYGVEQFNVEWRAFAEAMRAVDESIVLIGPELHQFGSDLQSTPKDPFGLDWMSAFLEVNGDLVDIVSIHRYPFPQGRGGRAATVEELAAASVEWDAIIPYLRELILEKTGRDLPIAVTEINSHWSNAIGGEATPDSYMNAIWWADVLGRMIKNQVAIVNYFTLQSHPSIGGYGLLSRSETRPTYSVYQIYQEFGENLVFAACDDPGLGMYAATGSDGSLTAILINLGSEAVTRPVIIDGGNYDLVSVWGFDETDLLHELTLSADEVRDGLDIKGYSIILLKYE
jgi:hypothetical protein